MTTSISENAKNSTPATTGRERGESFLDKQAEKRLRELQSPSGRTTARDDLVHHEAERATIAALIRNGGDPIGRLGITADLFALDATREAFQAVDRMFRSGVHPDAATLRNALSAATYIEIETTIGEHVSAANLPAHVAILKDYRQRRAEAAARDRLARAIESSVPPHELASLFDAVRAASAGDSGDKTAPPPWKSLDLDTMRAARLHPRCIVEYQLYADLAVMNAEGGTGKTTLLLYETIHIALRRDLWGCRVLNPGRTLFITAEDGEELLQARLREVMTALNLTDYERQKVCENVMFWDVTGSLVRLAELDARGNLQLTELADRIVETYRDANLAQVIFDPCISFGPGERIVNDGEQAIVTACRRIIRGLNCCVRLVHHTGKSNARNGEIDQYAGRGGTALPDGCRMVTILANAERATIAKPDGWTLQPGESGFVMVRAKLSYTGPQPNIWIRRRGWTFEWTIEEPRNSDTVRDHDADKVAKFLTEELHHGRRYTANTLEQSGKSGLSRSRLRAALATLETNGRVTPRDLPPELRQGGRKVYLHPLNLAATSGEVPANILPTDTQQDPTSPTSTTSPPYRECNGGEVAAAITSPNSTTSPANIGEVPAKWRSRDESPQDNPANPTVEAKPPAKGTAATLEAEGRRLLEEAKTAPSGVKVLPTGEYVDDPAPGSRVDLRNRGNLLLEQARVMRLSEDGKRESPPTHAAPPICRPAEGYPFRLIVKCDKPMPIYGPDGGDPVGCESCGARWGARP